MIAFLAEAWDAFGIPELKAFVFVAGLCIAIGLLFGKDDEADGIEKKN